MKEKPKINILIDTNLLIRSSVQPNERQDLERLIKYSKEGIVKLIVSEIIIDEIEKHKNGFEQKLNEEMGKVSKGVREFFQNNRIWNDLYDFEKYIVDSIYEYKGKKYDLYLAFLDDFDKLIKDEDTEILKPDIKKFYETQRKVINGQIPAFRSNDIHLIDCIEEISKKLSQYEKLMFVTENKKDFFESDENGTFLRKDDSSYIIKGLNNTNLHGFISMNQLLDYIRKGDLK